MNQHMQWFHQEAFNTYVTGVTDKEEAKPQDNLHLLNNIINLTDRCLNSWESYHVFLAPPCKFKGTKLEAFTYPAKYVFPYRCTHVNIYVQPIHIVCIYCKRR